MAPWLTLALASLAALLAAAPSAACPLTVIPLNQELFRDAARIYEGVALDESFRFRVEKVWRGPEAETVHLPWAARNVHGCVGQDPAIPGRRYLIVIVCADPAEGDTFDYHARTEDLEHADDRLRYLEESRPLGPDEVADALRGWLDGSWTTEALASWASEMWIVGQVDDWIDTGGVLISPTLDAVGMTGFFLTGMGDLRQARECRKRVLREEVVPNLLVMVTDDDIERQEAASDAADDAYMTFWDDCEEAFSE
jgi:hypothetical protein